MGGIKRTVGSSNTVVSVTMVYKAWVHAIYILEYISPVWSHNLVKDIKALEVIQSKASKIALKQKYGEMPYEQHCKLLKWDFLKKRIVYSIHLFSNVIRLFNLNGIIFDEIFEYKHSRKTRANHKNTQQTNLATYRINCYRVSFFVRIIDQWNGLPHNLVEEGNFISYIWTNITQRFSYARDFSLGF